MRGPCQAVTSRLGGVFAPFVRGARTRHCESPYYFEALHEDIAERCVYPLVSHRQLHFIEMLLSEIVIRNPIQNEGSERCTYTTRFPSGWTTGTESVFVCFFGGKRAFGQIGARNPSKSNDEASSLKGRT